MSGADRRIKQGNIAVSPIEIPPTSDERQRFRMSTVLRVLLSVIYGVIMLWLGGPLTGLYSPSPFHRFQAEALMHGHFCLSDSVETLGPGLAWHNGAVQQVWGLGVGMWLLPFEAVWRLKFATTFPDRIGLGFAFALLAYYVGSTATRLARDGRGTFGVGLLWIVLLCPGLWTLARVPQLVFEQTGLYALIASLGILVSVVRVASFVSLSDYAICCCLSALAPWVRPTHGLYSVAAVVVSTAIILRKSRNVKAVSAGVCSLLASLALLAWGNYVRFGSPTEFGHRLTVSSQSMMYLIRFGNPYRESHLTAAAPELFGALFLNSHPRDAWAYSEDLFPGQARTTRWRRLYLSVFDPVYAFACAAALVVATVWLFRVVRKGGLTSEPNVTLVMALWVWAGAAFAGLAAFYLYFPILASRYLMDFAPAIAGLTILAWDLLSYRWPKCSCLLLALWLIYELASAQTPVSEPVAPSTPGALTLSSAQGTAVADFGGMYSETNHPVKTGIFGNGYGWDGETGIAGDVISLVLDNPKLVEMRVSGRRSMNGDATRPDAYRAQIDRVTLPLKAVTREDDGFRVEFSVPESVCARNETQVLFLCFSSGYDTEDRESERFLYSVRWR